MVIPKISENLPTYTTPVTLTTDSRLFKPSKGVPDVTQRRSNISQNLGWIVACGAIGTLGFVIGRGPQTAHAQQNQPPTQPQRPSSASSAPMLAAAAPITRDGSTRAIALFDQFGNMQLLQPVNAAVWMNPINRGTWSLK